MVNNKNELGLDKKATKSIVNPVMELIMACYKAQGARRPYDATLGSGNTKKIHSPALLREERLIL